MTDLADLARRHGWKTVVPARMNCLEANRLLLERSELPGILVDVGDERRLLSKTRFREELARPFRQDIYAQRSVGELPKTCFIPLTVIEEDTAIEEGAALALGRDQDHVYEPVVIRPRAGEDAILDVFHVFLALTGRLNEEIGLARTLLEEVNRTNDLLLQGMSYASRLQGALMPKAPAAPMDVDAAVLFRPRDRVSGDFYWFTADEERFFAVVADCTGHGVPGAMISMTAMPMIQRLCEQHGLCDPAGVFTQLNREMRGALHGAHVDDGSYDDGMEAVACSVDRRSGRAVVASAGLSFEYVSEDDAQRVRAFRTGIGYRENPEKVDYEAFELDLPPGATALMFTDGFTEQIGGDKSVMLGRRRLLKMVRDHLAEDLTETLETTGDRIDAYRGEETVRDDQTLFAFRLANGAAS